MTEKEIIGAIAVFFTLIGYGHYLFRTLSGKAKPHLFSWAIWGLLAAVAGVAQIVKGAGPGAWTTMIGSASCFLIAGLSLKFGDKQFHKTDKRALYCALSAIPIWLLMGDPLYAVFMVCAITFFGFIPTFRKAWNKPFEEPALLYALNTLKFILALAAMETANPTALLYPLLVACMDASFVTMLVFRRRKLAPTK
jgi:hypothetical protein